MLHLAESTGLQFMVPFARNSPPSPHIFTVLDPSAIQILGLKISSPERACLTTLAHTPVHKYLLTVYYLSLFYLSEINLQFCFLVYCTSSTICRNLVRAGSCLLIHQSLNLGLKNNPQPRVGAHLLSSETMMKGMNNSFSA